MKIRVSEATNSQLDWLVAVCERYNPTRFEPKGDFCFAPHVALAFLSEYTPTTDWAQGGPIIEREGVTLARNISNIEVEPDVWQLKMTTWKAQMGYSLKFMAYDFSAVGQTPLIAAMCCFVASKLGDEVEVPNELA